MDKVFSKKYQLCYFRLRCVLNRLERDNLLVKYDDIIRGQLYESIIEEVKGNQQCCKVFYLPHHPVVTLGKETTKLEIVYDVFAKSGTNTLSLNESLSRGPVMLPELCGILLRFQTFTYRVIADIEKAFL